MTVNKASSVGGGVVDADAMSLQIDGLSFLVALTLAAVAALCAHMSLAKNEPLPWGWLGCFAFFQAFGDLVSLVAGGLGGGVVVHVIHGSVEMAACVCLYGFARGALSRGSERGAWALLASLALLSVLWGWSAGAAGVVVLLRADVYVVVGGAAAVALANVSRNQGGGARGAMRWAAGSMVALALASLAQSAPWLRGIAALGLLLSLAAYRRWTTDYGRRTTNYRLLITDHSTGY